MIQVSKNLFCQKDTGVFVQALPTHKKIYNYFDQDSCRKYILSLKTVNLTRAVLERNAASKM